mgnify:CR=1 FL=1
MTNDIKNGVILGLVAGTVTMLINKYSGVSV